MGVSGRTLRSWKTAGTGTTNGAGEGVAFDGGVGAHLAVLEDRGHGYDERRRRGGVGGDSLRVQPEPPGLAPPHVHLNALKPLPHHGAGLQIRDT